MHGSRLGFGVSGPLGERWFPEASAFALIAQAWRGGVRCFDTAPFHGGGEGERRLGAQLRALDARGAIVSTKTGTRRATRRIVKDFTESAIRFDVEKSLRNLQRPRVDLLYLHGPSRTEMDAARPTLEALKRDGAIAGYGVCGSGDALDHAVRGEWDAIMGVYNIFDRSNGPVFAAAREKGLAVAAIAPLAQGLYDPKLFRLRSRADVWRAARALLRSRSDLKRARSAHGALASLQGWSSAETALGFVMANNDVDAAFTTTTNPAHLAESLRAAGRALSNNEKAALDRALAGA